MTAVMRDAAAVAAAPAGADAAKAADTGDALAKLLRLAESAPTLAESVALLRQVLPAMRVSAMDAFDLRHETPVARGERRTLFLARHDGHCWSLTTDPAQAGALFVTDTPAA